jgi:hypothetical protein
MTKKKGLQSVLNESSAVDSTFKKLSRKEQGKAIGGNPDETDFNHITIWIDMFEKAYPGVVLKMFNDVKVQLALSDTNKWVELSKDSEFRRLFWLPYPLQEIFERAYPSFWTNKKHAEWFCKKFPQFAFATAAKVVKS